MNKIEFLEHFDKRVEKLLKDFPRVIKDIRTFHTSLLADKENPTPLGSGFFKSRVKNSDKNKGKSAGYRIITYYVRDEKIYFVEIYDKSERESISKDELMAILKKEGII
jgi:hypothetical protein